MGTSRTSRAASGSRPTVAPRPADSRPTVAPRPAATSRTAAAGVAFVLAWALGLAVWPSNLDVSAGGAEVIEAYRGHAGAAVVQALLVHGAAAAALAVVVLGLGRALSESGAARAGRVAVVAGLAAAAVSLVQCAVGVWLAGWAVGGGEAVTCGNLFEAVNRLDGVKMGLLAALAVAASTPAVLPRWVRAVGGLLAAALVVSGLGYLLLVPGLAAAAFVSGPLLLVWVCAAGLTCGRRGRARTPQPVA